MIKVTPLGGLGEIGSNMVCWSDGKNGFIVDCGILFPDEELFEINYLIPNFDHLDPEHFKTILITHAHEDHIGAIIHIVKWNPKIVIYATNYAKHMIKKKLNELKMTAKFKDINVDAFKLGDWKINSIDINHSTPETQCLIISHLKHSVSFCYASDFKINTKPTDGAAFNPSKVKKLMSPYKFRMGMLDSTNILNTGKTVEEGELVNELDLLIEKQGRCFITFFTSNVCRLNNIVKLAKKHGRTISIVGRSVWNTVNIAIESEVAEFSLEDFCDVEDLVNKEDEKLLFIVAGCQGDFKSALRRIAYGEDSHIKLKQGDQFIFSSKVIPGNEDKISKIYNKLAALGVEIITAPKKLIHCSGHPGQEDLKMFLDATDFTHYVPVHGETYFLHLHQEFVKKNYSALHVSILNNGEEITINPQDNFSVTISPNLEWKEPKLILNAFTEVERSQISQRRKVAASGAVFLSIGTKRTAWKCTMLGLPLILADKKDWLLDQLFDYISNEGKNKSAEQASELIRIKCRNLINSQIGIKPVCIIH